MKKIALRTLGESHNVIVANLTEELLKHLKNGFELSKQACGNNLFSNGFTLKIPFENDISVYRLRSNFVNKVEKGSTDVKNYLLEQLAFDIEESSFTSNYVIFEDDEYLNSFLKDGARETNYLIISENCISIKNTVYSKFELDYDLSEEIPVTVFENLI